MSKKIILLCLIIIPFFCNAQSVLKIEYKRYFLSTKFNQSSSNFGIPNPMSLRVLLNDSIGFMHYFGNGLKPLKNTQKQYGQKIIHHSTYFDFISNRDYGECDLPDLPSKYLSKNDCDSTLNWVIYTEQHKSILGYECTAALAVSANNDSTLVFYTTKIKYIHGYLFYKGIPGTILEVFDQQRGAGIHYIATKLEEINLQLVAPTEGVIIECAAFREMIKQRNAKHGGNNFKVIRH